MAELLVVGQKHNELYKMRGGDQLEKRRREILSNQHSKRQELLDEYRSIVETQFLPQPRKKSRRHYDIADMLMLSEWFLEIPGDFSESWKFIVCPEGRRCLIVAKNGITMAVSKKGKEFGRWESPLPGGSGTQPGGTTILDCVYSDAKGCYYVLDLLHWGEIPFVGTEMNFRQFWIQSRIKDELPELGALRRPIIPLDAYPCCKESVEEIFSTFPYFSNNVPKVDGILFYHQDAHYVRGQTPLVGWLKVFMIPEVFGVTIAGDYFDNRPENYVNYLEFVNAFDLKKRKTCDMEFDEG